MCHALCGTTHALQGRYHWRTRLQAGIVEGYVAPSLVAPGRLTIGGVAQQSGYRTAFIGKSHIGGLGWPLATAAERAALFTPPRTRNGTVEQERLQRWQDVFSRPVASSPTSYGFDEFFGLEHNIGALLIEGNRTVLPLPDHWARPDDGHAFGPTPSTWHLESLLPNLTRRAVTFIETTTRARTQPFLLYFASTSPHAPHAVGDGWRGRSGISRYADWVMQSDGVVGELTAAIDAAGVARNTLLLVTSDHGQLGAREPTTLPSDAEMMRTFRLGHQVNGRLRGGKSDAFEGGHRVPLLVRWPVVRAHVHNHTHVADAHALHEPSSRRTDAHPELS